MDKLLVDQMILGSGHSIIFASSKQASAISFGIKDDSMNFGLFQGKYAEDEGEDAEGYIEPTYRLLSEAIVAKKYNPTDFSKKDVLKNSMPLLIGQTVYTDHDTSTDNQVGAIKEVYWQEAYKSDGITIPAGVNGKFRIDAKSNPKLARGIQSTPPSIHSNSVSVTFSWEPSHKFDNLWDFYDKLGTFDDKGELVRRIVTGILSYSESSLVSHGADPFAQKILKSGKINNIPHAAANYYGAMKNAEDYNEVAKRSIYFGDFKSLDTMENGSLSYEKLHNTGNTNNKGEDNSTKQNNMNKDKKKTDGTAEEAHIDLSSLFGEGMLSHEDNAELTLELAKESILALIGEKAKLTEANLVLKEKEVIADKYIDSVRSLTLENFKKVSGGEEKADKNLMNLIQTSNINVLESLGLSYQTQMEEKFKLRCSKCNSTDVSRSASLSENENEDEEDLVDEEISTQDIIKRMTDSKLSKK